MSRKPDAIDLIKLYSEGDYKEWNIFLTNCFQKRDIEKLVVTRRRLQAGMHLAAKKKLNTEKVINLFIRLQKSIEDTIKKIIREQDPNPCDNPLTAMDNLERKGDKTRRDSLVESYLKKTGY